MSVSFMAATLRQGNSAGAFNAASDHPNAVNGMGLPTRGAYAGMPSMRTGVTTDERLSASVLIACACAGLLLGCSPEAYSAAATDCIKQLGGGLVNATLEVGIDNLDQIVADDWVPRRRFIANVSIRPRLVRRASGS